MESNRSNRKKIESATVSLLGSLDGTLGGDVQESLKPIEVVLPTALTVILVESIM